MVEEVVVEIGVVPVVTGSESELALGQRQVEPESGSQSHEVAVLAAHVAPLACRGGQVNYHVVVQGRTLGRVPHEKLGIGNEAFEFHLRFCGPE